MFGVKETGQLKSLMFTAGNGSAAGRARAATAHTTGLARRAREVARDAQSASEK